MHAHPSDDDTGPRSSALFVDLYEVTMAQAYAAEGMRAPAVFELFFRTLPPRRNFVLACGLEAVVDFLEGFRFTPDEIAYLRDQDRFAPWFLDELAGLRFTGDVYAVPEGTATFADEPLVQVVAPVLEAQLAETFLLNQIHVASVAASKAARVVRAARGRTVVDFGSRRTQGLDAALCVARASWIAGAAGTSNLLAGMRDGIPTFGTMAHSYVQAHDDETEAFRRFMEQFPGTTLLVDTYDTLAGVDAVIELAGELGDAFAVNAIRLDSGDLGDLARRARERLDAAGLDTVRIIASGGLDEHAIHALLAGGAPIDGFGVGTRLGVSEDAPTLDLAYKLVAYDGRPRLKTSGSKETLPARKQVFRTARDDRFAQDVIGLFEEDLPGEPLLQPVMRDGRRVAGATPALTEVRAYAGEQLDRLPADLLALDPAEPPYPVAVSDGLRATRDRLREESP